MNMWQKICIAMGALIIALMFLAFPVQATKEVPLTGFAKVGNLTTTTIEKYVDYTSTGLRALGVAAGTMAIALFLGFVPRQKN